MMGHDFLQSDIGDPAMMDPSGDGAPRRMRRIPGAWIRFEPIRQRPRVLLPLLTLAASAVAFIVMIAVWRAKLDALKDLQPGSRHEKRLVADVNEAQGGLVWACFLFAAVLVALGVRTWVLWHRPVDQEIRDESVWGEFFSFLGVLAVVIVWAIWEGSDGSAAGVAAATSALGLAAVLWGMGVISDWYDDEGADEEDDEEFDKKEYRARAITGLLAALLIVAGAWFTEHVGFWIKIG
jgi:hypothetical protein